MKHLSAKLLSNTSQIFLLLSTAASTVHDYCEAQQRSFRQLQTKHSVLNWIAYRNTLHLDYGGRMLWRCGMTYCIYFRNTASKECLLKISKWSTLWPRWDKVTVILQTTFSKLLHFNLYLTEVFCYGIIWKLVNIGCNNSLAPSSQQIIQLLFNKIMFIIAFRFDANKCKWHICIISIKKIRFCDMLKQLWHTGCNLSKEKCCRLWHL